MTETGKASGGGFADVSLISFFRLFCPIIRSSVHSSFHLSFLLSLFRPSFPVSFVKSLPADLLLFPASFF
jgi:hypothetical protein